MKVAFSYGTVHVYLQFTFIVNIFFILVAKPKSPPRSKPSVYEEMAAERARAAEEARRVPIPGDLPKFKVKLPKTVELEEGDRLRLEVRADGTPNPLGKCHSMRKMYNLDLNLGPLA